MITKLEKMAEDYTQVLWGDTCPENVVEKQTSKVGYLTGAKAFRHLVLEYLVSPISDCYLEQRGSLSRQEVIDLLEGVSDKINHLGNEEIEQ